MPLYKWDLEGLIDKNISRMIFPLNSCFLYIFSNIAHGCLKCILL